MDLYPRRGRISFHITPREGSAQELRVRAFHGSEDLSELFGFEVALSSEATLSPSEAVGQPAILVVGDETRVFHGIVAMFELQGSSADGALTYYHARLVPTVWQLKQGRNCRIFQNLTVQQIAETLLKEWGLEDKRDFAFSLDPGTKLAERVYCVQYNESDWGFITRLLSEEGIHFFFVHEGAEEDGPAEWRDKLVVTDTPAQHPGVRVPAGHATDADSGKPALTVQAPTEQNVAEEHVTRLVARQQVGPTSYTVRDQVFDMPWLLDTSEARGKGERRPIEVFEYTGAPKSRLTGDLPQLRLEALEVPRLVFDGDAGCPGVSPGSVFVADECSLLEALGEEDHQLLVLSVVHHGVQPQAESTDAGSCQYGNTFRAILARQPFRPERRKAGRPVIPGVQSAIVVGPPNEEIYTDDLGRVKVQFPWDRYGENNERSSCWVPVAQTWSSSGWGTLFTPRVDQQVLVQFIDGDPDQPLIVGQAYHLHNKPPYELPKRKTVSTIKTDSSPKGDGYNEIRFEDRKGAEELYVRAELDRNDLVQRNYTTTVGNDETLDVGNDYTEKVKKDYKQTIERNKTIKLTGKHEETVKKTMTLDVKGPLTETVENGRVVKVGKLHETVKGQRKTVVEQGNYDRVVKKGDSTLTVAGDVTVISKQGQGAVTTHGNLDLTAEDGECNVSGKTWVGLTCADGQFPRLQLSPDNISLRIGGSTIAMTQNSITIVMGTNSITIDDAGITLNGQEIKSTAMMLQEIAGAMVKIN